MNAPEPAVHAAASQAIPLAFIAVSPTNPRKHFDQAALDELTASVKRHGVISPVLVRSGSSKKDPRILWELVAGERRFRAAKAAGLAEIPAIVRSLTDVEALELQVIENLQREDLHPLEEAEGYEQLMKLYSYAVEDLAAKVGKSKAYVYARLKLTALTPAGRKAFYAGELNPSTALLVARIPVPALQDKAMKEITARDFHGEVRYGVRGAAEHLRSHYMLRLADAPFPPNDEKLVSKAGPCAACPKRTGNQPELFGDVKGADVCTDPECFEAKKNAHLQRVRAAAEAKGQKVIVGKEAKKIIPYDGVDSRSGYLELDAKNWDDPKHRTYRQLLGKDCPLPTLIERRDGQLVEVVAAKEISGTLKDKVPKLPSSRGNDDQRRREAKARLETAIRSATFEAIIAGHPGTMTPVDAALIAEALFDRTDHECTKRILKRWEPEAAAKAGNSLWDVKKAFLKRIPTLAPPELVRLMVELALSGEIHVGAYSSMGRPEALNETAARLGIDHAAIRSELTRAAKEKGKAKKTAAPKPKTKPARKAKASPAQPQESA